MEQFANNCSTTVAAGGYSVGSGVLNVVSTAAPFPQVGNFRVSIFDKNTNALKVILKVTGVNSTTQFAVTAEGTDAGAAVDDIVRGTMLTAGALDAIISGINVFDIPPSIPNAMDDEFSENSLNGKWTILNQQGGQSISVANSFVTMTSISTVVKRIFAITQPAPSGSWRFRTKFFIDCATWNYFGFGMLARIPGTNKSYYCGPVMHSTYGTQTMYVGGATDLNTGLAIDLDLYDVRSQVYYMEMEYDGTGLTWRVSFSGAAYTRIYSIPVATWLGGAPEVIGLNMHAYGDSDVNMGLVASVDWFRRVA